MIVEEVMFFGMMGLLTSLILWMISAENDKRHFFPLMLTGLTSGWITGVIYVYATGGLSLPMYAILFPVFISMFFSAIVLFYMPEPKITTPVSSKLFNVSLIIMIIMALVVAYTSIPITGASTSSTENYANIQMQSIKTMRLDSKDVEAFSATPTNQIPINIDALTSSVSLLSSSETPYVGSYLSFRLTFSVSGYDWVKPYVKIGIFKDNDGDGTISDGDELWTSANYKVVTNYGSWRANVKYANGQPTEEIFASQKTYTEPMLLPIFHASQISRWKDDTQYTFTNTPESYKPPQDMLSWDGNTLKETVTAYEAIPVGTSKSIEGKIYCPPNSQGKYLILVQAYDARYTEPYENNDPLSQKIIPFEIKEGKPSVTIDWTMAVILTAVTIPSVVGAILYKRW